MNTTYFQIDNAADYKMEIAAHIKNVVIENMDKQVPNRVTERFEKDAYVVIETWKEVKAEYGFVRETRIPASKYNAKKAKEQAEAEARNKPLSAEDIKELEQLFGL